MDVLDRISKIVKVVKDKRPRQFVRYADLLAANNTSPLSPDEQAELEALIDALGVTPEEVNEHALAVFNAARIRREMREDFPKLRDQLHLSKRDLMEYGDAMNETIRKLGEECKRMDAEHAKLQARADRHSADAESLQKMERKYWKLFGLPEPAAPPIEGPPKM